MNQKFVDCWPDEDDEFARRYSHTPASLEKIGTNKHDHENHL